MESKYDSDSSSERELDSKHTNPSAKATTSGAKLNHQSSTTSVDDDGSNFTSVDDDGSNFEPHELVSAVANWFYTNDDLLERIEQFLESHKNLFSTEGGNPDSPDEFSLAQYDAYNAYCKLWEEEIETFVTSELSSSVSEFTNALSLATGSKTDITSGVNVATAISCTTTFNAFAVMMKNYLLDGVGPIICPPLLNEETDALEFE